MTEYLPWNLYQELRSEIVESQKRRDQLLWIKATAVPTAIAVSLGQGTAPGWIALGLLAVYAALTDVASSGIAVRVKELGRYLRDVVEPQLAEHESWATGMPLWEQYIDKNQARRYLTVLGTSGMTAMVSVAAVVFAFDDGLITGSAVAAGLAGLNAVAVWSGRIRWKLGPRPWPGPERDNDGTAPTRYSSGSDVPPP